MARMSDPWLAAFEEAKSTADEVFHLLTERDEAMTQGSQEGVVMRLTAAARRKWSALGSRIEQLEKALTYGGQCVWSESSPSPAPTAIVVAQFQLLLNNLGTAKRRESLHLSPSEFCLTCLHRPLASHLQIRARDRPKT